MLISAAAVARANPAYTQSEESVGAASHQSGSTASVTIPERHFPVIYNAKTAAANGPNAGVFAGLATVEEVGGLDTKNARGDRDHAIGAVVAGENLTAL